MFKNLRKVFGGDPIGRELERCADRIEAINALEPELRALSDEALRAKTDLFRRRLADGESLDDLLAEAFAVVREARCAPSACATTTCSLSAGSCCTRARSPRCAPAKARRWSPPCRST